MNIVFLVSQRNHERWRVKHDDWRKTVSLFFFGMRQQNFMRCGQRIYYEFLRIGHRQTGCRRGIWGIWQWRGWRRRQASDVAARFGIAKLLINLISKYIIIGTISKFIEILQLSGLKWYILWGLGGLELQSLQKMAFGHAKSPKISPPAAPRRSPQARYASFLA